MFPCHWFDRTEMDSKHKPQFSDRKANDPTLSTWLYLLGVYGHS